MDSFTKKEKGLREIIENQKEQLGRYEKKLRGIDKFVHLFHTLFFYTFLSFKWMFDLVMPSTIILQYFFQILISRV